jgi:hypothetical protein
VDHVPIADASEHDSSGMKRARSHHEDLVAREQEGPHRVAESGDAHEASLA